MTTSSSTVSAELGLALVVPEEDAVVPLTAGLSYSEDDPYAVRLDLHVGLEEPVRWIFARELLSLGMEGVYGLGDVRVWPSLRSRDGQPGMMLNIELSSPHGHANFVAPLQEVSDFLCRSYGIVPPGRESDHVDVDAALAGLLRQAS